MLTTFLLSWTLVQPSVSATVEAQELTMSQIDPTFLLSQFSQEKSDKQKTKEMLRRYAKGSKYVVVGQIQTINRLSTGEYLDQEAYVLLDGWLRGKPEEKLPELLRIEKQYNAPYIDKDWETVTGVLVEEYNVVIFLDQKFRVVEGDTIFYNDGENLWRNNAIFCILLYDREWTTENPYDDYVVIPHSDVRSMLQNQKPAAWLR